MSNITLLSLKTKLDCFSLIASLQRRLEPWGIIVICPPLSMPLMKFKIVCLPLMKKSINAWEAAEGADAKSLHLFSYNKIASPPLVCYVPVAEFFGENISTPAKNLMKEMLDTPLLVSMNSTRLSHLTSQSPETKLK